ncbi:hypothetical protein CEXT_306291 [Caerostris extrusa]|uniref:Uncharacterized protein n=1 Tax=Caerostris extrusa TaxID=172846 RepID=A0AAV4T8Z3_CAEEX|nr:hypothetical protein CEXT_306291 [Caerostris extrusa]
MSDIPIEFQTTQIRVEEKCVVYNGKQSRSRTSYKSEEIRYSSNEQDLEEFVSASEDGSSSSETFFETEDFCDMPNLKCSEKENLQSYQLRGNPILNPSKNFANDSFVNNKTVHHRKSQTCPAAELKSGLFNFDEPLIIQYVDGQTNQAKEIFIYPMECYEELSNRKNNNREEILEKLVEKK